MRINSLLNSLRGVTLAAILSAGGCCTTDAVKADPGLGSHGGPYAGITIGYSSQTLSTPGIDLAGQGVFGGAYIGAGMVTGGLYLGIEGDVSLRDVRSKVAAGAYTLEAGADWTATVRGRIGIPVGPAMPYLTAGVAIQESKLALTGAGTATELQYGLAAGGGMELNVTKTLHVRLEGMHYAFPSESYSFGALGSTGKVDLGETVIRAGIGFKLN